MPLLVIGRDKEHCITFGIEEGFPESELTLFEEKWQELIMQQVSLSQNSKFVVAHKASHSIHIDRPDIITESITWMIKNFLFK